MNADALYPVIVAALGALCVALAVGWLFHRRRARARLAEAQRQTFFYKSHSLTLAKAAIDGAWKEPLKNRLDWAADPLVFPPEGPLDERRACLDFHRNARTIPLRQLRKIKDDPTDPKRALLTCRHLAHILAAHYLTSGWRADFFTAVPSSQRHLAQRGYDPSELLARETAKLVKMSFRPVLLRARETPGQREVRTRAARLQNVQGAFQAAQDVKGKRIVIIEDVTTTGATLLECAAVLKAAGADRVYALCLASSGRPRTSRALPADTASSG